MSPQLLHNTIVFYELHRAAVNAIISNSIRLLLVSGVLATIAQLVKRKYTKGDRIYFKVYKWQVDFDMKKFVTLLAALLSFTTNVANSYLGQPQSVQALIGNTAVLFTVMTFVHRFGVSKADGVITDFLDYLASRKPPITDSSGTPSV